MAFKIKLDAYRCFKETNWVTVKPLTLLIGNNSSGKTSFLAAVRYILNSLSSNATASFNQEPFFLGAFDQIAHFRQGKAGRARNFQIGIELSPEFIKGPRKEIITSPIQVSLKFSSASGQPANASAIIHYENSTLKADLGNEAQITVSDRQTNQLPLFQDSPRQDTFAIPRVTFDTLKYILSDMRFLARRGGGDRTDAQMSRTEPEEAIMRAAQRAEHVGRILQLVAHRLDKGVVAGAPVRTRPERTYQPVEELGGGEGADIPLLLARLSATDKVEWDRVKSALDNFGRASGLFKEISIRRLGKSASDPFQVLVKISGPSSNLIDVGYGVSQALPLITELVRSVRPRTFLYQQPEVHLHPSAQAELATLFGTTAARRRHTLLIETHSDFLIDRIRMDIRDKKSVPFTDATILYFERDGLDTKIHEIGFDVTGQLLGAPPGYREFFIREQIRSLQSTE